MKTRNAVSKLLTVATLAAILIAAAAILDKGQVTAFNPQPDPPAFGMVGITHAQSARLNVADTSEVQPGPCRQVEMTFFDGEGNVLMRSSQCLMPGHAVFLDLNGISVVGTSPRTEIRATAHLIEPRSESDRNRFKIAATLEVFDNETGRTIFALPAVQ